MVMVIPSCWKNRSGRRSTSGTNAPCFGGSSHRRLCVLFFFVFFLFQELALTDIDCCGTKKPFPLDYREVMLSLCDILAFVYSKLIEDNTCSENVFLFQAIVRFDEKIKVRCCSLHS
jgi:hypothetical protein